MPCQVFGAIAGEVRFKLQVYKYSFTYIYVCKDIYLAGSTASINIIFISSPKKLKIKKLKIKKNIYLYLYFFLPTQGEFFFSF